MCLSPRRRPVAPALKHIWRPSGRLSLCPRCLPGGRPRTPDAGFARGQARGSFCLLFRSLVQAWATWLTTVEKSQGTYCAAGTSRDARRGWLRAHSRPAVSRHAGAETFRQARS
jgi:hypothetical protein